ncbi:Peptidase family M23 [Arthrobacter crystallopoietes]|uniref:Peptidase family M23 n=1 Tax=Crystallibacter crystallopoietes TaxID=37928 RepID=A0A1H1H5Y5_9MICC|nr:Peptidase family M23 [Arthrobacter crystallopoietes]
MTAANVQLPGTPPATAMTGSYAPIWGWPTDPKPAVLAEFDPPPEPWSRGHRGVDLKTNDGASVLAPQDGTVSFVGWVVDRPVITIDHGNGLRSSFEPVSSELEKGDPVDKGAELGTVEGTSHCPPGCLHWGVRQGEEYINPLQFVMDMRPSVLLPRPME